MNLNYTNKTIEMTNAEAKRAGDISSSEYAKLATMRASFPNYEIAIKKTTKRKDSIKGLTYDYMEKYINTHDNAEENMEEYRFLRGLDNNNGLNITTSYGEIRKWFLATYPEIEEYQNKINKLVNKAS